MGRAAMMTGAQTCVKMLNPAVNQSSLPYRTTRMDLNPAEETGGGGGVMERLRRQRQRREARQRNGKQNASLLLTLDRETTLSRSLSTEFIIKYAMSLSLADSV